MSGVQNWSFQLIGPSVLNEKLLFVSWRTVQIQIKMEQNFLFSDGLMTLCKSVAAKSGECRFRICFLLKRQVWCSWYWVATLKKFWSTKFHFCKILVGKHTSFNKNPACQLISSTSCGNGCYLSMLFGVYVGIIFFFNLGPTLRQFPWSLRPGCGKSIWSLRTKIAAVICYHQIII